MLDLFRPLSNEARRENRAAYQQFLLDRGADPNAVASRCERCIHEPRSEDGSADLTALMLARQRGETDIVKMLIAAGAKR